VACLLFVETQSCSDLGGGGIYPDPPIIYHRGSPLPAAYRNSYIQPTGAGVGGGGLGAGLAPPRSPELRRHSDVSPASLKELEKVAGERREELRWEREMEWRQHGKRESSSRGSPGTSRVGSPQSERRPIGEERSWDPRLKSGKWNVTLWSGKYFQETL
jgi:hypothetical protein